MPNLQGGSSVSKTVKNSKTLFVQDCSFNYSEVFFEFLCPTGESVCVVVDACMTDFKCCDLQYSD